MISGTTVAPSVTGYYWFWTKGYQPAIVYLYRNYGHGGALTVNAAGTLHGANSWLLQQFRAMFPEGRWQGPLEPEWEVEE